MLKNADELKPFKVIDIEFLSLSFIEENVSIQDPEIGNKKIELKSAFQLIKQENFIKIVPIDDEESQMTSE